MTALIPKRLIVMFAFLMPAVGVLAPKGTVILLVVTGLAGLLWWAKEGFPALPVNYRIIAALAALALWAAISAAWAIAPAKALLLVVKLTGLAVAGIGLLFAVSRLDDGHRRDAETALLWGMALGLAALVVGFVYAKTTGRPLWSASQSDPLTTLNNGAVAISLLAWPVLAVLWRRGRKRLVAAAAAAVYLAFMFLSSGAALLAPVTGLAAFLVVWTLGRRGALIFAAIIAALVLFAPQVVSSFVSGDKVKEISAELSPSALHRLDMWGFTAEKIAEKPLWGWGMDASRSIPGGGRHLAPEVEILPLHPHNAFLQVRLELGMPGIIIVAALAGLFFAAVVGGAGDRFAAAVMAGAGGSYLTVASVSYGIWQNWWVAFAWALAALTALAVRSSSPG